MGKRPTPYSENKKHVLFCMSGIAGTIAIFVAFTYALLLIIGFLPIIILYLILQPYTCPYEEEISGEDIYL